MTFSSRTRFYKLSEGVDSCNLTNAFHGQLNLGTKLNNVRQVVFTAGFLRVLIHQKCSVNGNRDHPGFRTAQNSF